MREVVFPNVTVRSSNFALTDPPQVRYNLASDEVDRDDGEYKAYFTVFTRNLSLAEVAQLVEHMTENHGVGSPILPLGTTYSPGIIP